MQWHIRNIPSPSLTLETRVFGFIRAPVTVKPVEHQKGSVRVEAAAQKALLPVVPALKPVPTPALLLAMLGVSDKVSDLIMSPGSLPIVELSGKLFSG